MDILDLILDIHLLLSCGPFCVAPGQLLLSPFSAGLRASEALISVAPTAQSLAHSKCVCVSATQSCLTLCDPVDCSPPGSSVLGILQAGILE